jgi:outer membrane receptor for ferrienterochelin and colicins
MASADYNTELGAWYVGLLVEGFYTKLVDPFVTEYIPGETEGSMISYRSNSKDGAKVAGINFELNLMPFRAMTISSGYTYQKSQYDFAQKDFNEKSFYRTPDSYGYMTIDWDLTEKFCVSASGTFTGSMLVPYFGLQDRGIVNYNPEDGALIKSDSFIDLGFKASYDFAICNNILQVYTGVKNMLNAYQNDFDSGINRDPGYMYGPNLPRTVYLGFAIKS